MGSFFRWIYCMNLPLLTILIAGSSVLFSFGYRRYKEKSWCKPLIGILLLGSIAAIVAVTLMLRSCTDESLMPTTIPFASYRKLFDGGNPEILRSNFMNVFLFYPSGFLSAVLLPRKWHPVLTVLIVCIVLAGISAEIEYFQYARALGQAEADDVIHNTLGAFIGSVSGYYLCIRSQ